MNCEIFRELVGDYVAEKLDEDRRRWFRDHLRECAVCRESALKRDPTLMFAVAQAKPAAPESVAACAAAVTTRIRQDRLEHRLRFHRRPWLAAAAAVVVMIGGGLVWRTMTIVGGQGGGNVAVDTAQEIEAQVSPPTVEVETAGEEVRVYQFATDGDSNTAVYFIVDPALEL